MKLSHIVLAIAPFVGVSLLAQTPGRVGRRLSDSALANRVAGCYELLDDGWQADSNLAKFSTLPQDPVRFEITNTPDKDWAKLSAFQNTTYFTVHADSIPDYGANLFTTWMRGAGNSATIVVSKPMPMAGLELRLAPRDSNLTGTILSWTDAPAPGEASEATHAVTAKRISCDKLAARHARTPNQRDETSASSS